MTPSAQTNGEKLVTDVSERKVNEVPSRNTMYENTGSPTPMMSPSDFNRFSTIDL